MSCLCSYMSELRLGITKDLLNKFNSMSEGCNSVQFPIRFNIHLNNSVSLIICLGYDRGFHNINCKKKIKCDFFCATRLLTQIMPKNGHLKKTPQKTELSN